MTEIEILRVLSSYLWEVILVFLAGTTTLFWVLYKKINNTFSREEVLQILDLKMIPLKESMDRHTDLLEKHTTVMEKVNDSLQLIHKDMAVVKVKVESLEDWKKEK